MVCAIVLLCALCAVTGCTPNPPPRWLDGGARLSFADANWVADGRAIELRSTGEVTQDGELLWVLDRVGRVVDDSFRPVALLSREGHLVGTDDVFLGTIGVHNAAPPWSGLAWLRVDSRGVVLLFGEGGQRVSGGRWVGCAGEVLRSCTLITHLVALASVPRRGYWAGPGPPYNPMFFPYYFPY
jgi:hypothetical protein